MREKVYGSIMRKEMAWHDRRENASGVLGVMLNSEVNGLGTVIIQTTSAYFEGYGAILIGLAIGLIHSWPIVVAICIVCPLIMISNSVGTKVKQRQWGMIVGEEKEDKEADIILADTIANWKTVASMANPEKLVNWFDKISTRRCTREIKQANCDAIQFGFSEFGKNVAFGLVYLVQAVLVYNWPDYEYHT